MSHDLRVEVLFITMSWLLRVDLALPIVRRMQEFSEQNKPKGGRTLSIPQFHAQIGSILQGQFKSPILPEAFPTFRNSSLFLLSPPPKSPIMHRLSWTCGTARLDVIIQPVVSLAGLPRRPCSSLGDPCLPPALTPWLLTSAVPLSDVLARSASHHNTANHRFAYCQFS